MKLRWQEFPNQVFTCRGLGVVVLVGGQSWFAYPYGAGELGPFLTRDQAQQSLERLGPQTVKRRPG